VKRKRRTKGLRVCRNVCKAKISKHIIMIKAQIFVNEIKPNYITTCIRHA